MIVCHVTGRLHDKNRGLNRACRRQVRRIGARLVGSITPEGRTMSEKPLDDSGSLIRFMGYDR
jgi:hypothetical protein